MGLDVSRLRRGDVIAGGGALVLLLDLFVLDWYGVKSPFTQTASLLPGATTTWNGWQGLQHLRWLVLVTVLLGFALVLFQAIERAPAIPIGVGVVLTVVGLLNLIALLYRVLVNQPGADDFVTQQAGAFVGLVAAAAIVAGAYLSLRDEGLPEGDARTAIETVHLSAAS